MFATSHSSPAQYVPYIYFIFHNSPSPPPLSHPLALLFFLLSIFFLFVALFFVSFFFFPLINSNRILMYSVWDWKQRNFQFDLLFSLSSHAFQRHAHIIHITNEFSYIHFHFPIFQIFISDILMEISFHCLLSSFVASSPPTKQVRRSKKKKKKIVRDN